MQLQLKRLKLELQYSAAAQGLYLRETLYLAPFRAEEAEHFARRLLSLLSLYELHPQLSFEASGGKKPDLFTLGELHHYQLWCQVDLPNDKQVHKASHQSEQVVLMLGAADQHKALSLVKGLNNVRAQTIPDETIRQCCDMLKGHMQLSVWREDQQLQITDGEHQLQLTVPLLSGNSHN